MEASYEPCCKLLIRGLHREYIAIVQGFYRVLIKGQLGFVKRFDHGSQEIPSIFKSRHNMYAESNMASRKILVSDSCRLGLPEIVDCR